MHLRPVLMVVFLVGLATAGSLARPSCASACSCVAPLPGIEAYGGPGEAVLVGRVGGDDGTGNFAFHVERWFHGGSAATVRLASGSQRQPDGTVAINTCGVQLTSGSHLVLVAHLRGDTYEPGSCLPIATVESPEGQQLLRDATSAFGPGLGPAADNVGENATPQLGIVLGVAALALLVGAVLVVARRERA